MQMQKTLFSRAINNQLKQRRLCKLQTNHHFCCTNLTSQDNHVDGEVPKQHFESWITLISTLANGGIDMDLTLHKASKILYNGIKPNAYSIVHLVRVSTDMGYDSYCRQLHCYILKSGFVYNVFVSNALMRFYNRVDSLGDAGKLFVEIPHPNVISWNSLISGHIKSGKFGKALGWFLELQTSEICGNEYTFTIALAACGQLGLLHLANSIHSNILKFGMESGIVVGNCLIDTYGKCGAVEDAVSVFDSMNDKDIISWNSVLAACARNGMLEEAFRFWRQMPIHDTISYNELISGIAQFGNIDDAIGILSNMPNHNSSSWTSIMTGYVNRNRPWEALRFLCKMHSNDVKMDEFSFSIVLRGAAVLSALTWGVLIHCCTVKCGLDTSVVVGSALIDMYSKCGQVKNAESMFRSLPNRNTVTWNAMISGYAHNGNSMEVIQLFEQLKKERDLKPDSVTFLNVLAACSHTEMPLQQVYLYFESMIDDYGIKPTVEHCCSMIRIMGRGGEIRRAEQMIYDLGFGSHEAVWRALLGACGVCKDLRVAEVAAAKIIELNGSDDYVYVMMSNIFADHHRWEEMCVMRKMMRSKRVIKETACSWIETEDIKSNSYLLDAFQGRAFQYA